LDCTRYAAHDLEAVRTELVVFGCLLLFLTSAGLVIAILRH
jgi:hypothetical protein